MAVETLVNTMRTTFQLPPYLEDAVIERALITCEARLARLNPLADFDADPVSQGLLTNYAYYELHHKADDFTRNYADDILSWQLTQEVTVNVEGQDSGAGIS